MVLVESAARLSMQDRRVTVFPAWSLVLLLVPVSNISGVKALIMEPWLEMEGQ
jgi:hypothetical protein